MSLITDIIKRGTRAAQSAASAVSAGTLYFVTDELKIERSSGSAWESFSGGAGWTLITTQALSAASHTITGLGSYSEILLFGYQMTVTGACVIQVVVSTDGGSTFLTTSGDYITIDSTAFTGANDTSLSCSNNGTGTRYMGRFITNFNTTNRKMSWTFNGVGNNSSYVIPTTTALNALKIQCSANAFSGGTLYVFGR